MGRNVVTVLHSYITKPLTHLVTKFSKWKKRVCVSEL